MVSRPKVSVIIPSYNQGQYIEETILSVLRQDYNNFELIVIDGGSGDNSVDIIKKYSDRIKYWISEKDEGQTHAILKGIEKSEGKYFMWLCSDDLIESSMLNISVHYHQTHPNAGLTYGNRIRIDSKGSIYSMQEFPSHKKWFLKWGFSIPQETTLISRAAYNRTQGLDKSLNMAMDFDLWCKLEKVSYIYHVPRFLGRFRIHQNNKSSEFTKEFMEIGFNGKYTSEYKKIYQRHFTISPSKVKMIIQKHYERIFKYIDGNK